MHMKLTGWLVSAMIVAVLPAIAGDVASVPARVVTKAASDVRIYLNPGHGGWGTDDRPMESIPFPKNNGGTSTSSFPDTCGFYESNTDLWKMLEARERLIAMGVPDENITLSRWNNGPYPRDGITYHSGSNFSRTFSVINAEVNAGNYDMFVSLHSNGTGSDHTLTNYELILYRQRYTESSGKYEATPPSSEMAKTMWSYHYMDEIDPHSTLSYSSRTVPYVSGDLTFYGSTSSTGYLGVLKHNPPGFLMEGFFHTYDPAKHRALNEDYCRQEGARTARGIAAWFSIPGLPTGDIMGTVKDKSAAISHSFYNYRTGTGDDMYTPIHGATVTLYKGDTFISSYTTDNLYNGVFVFEDLVPGSDYYITVKKDGYSNLELQGPYTVTANETTYPQLYMTAGTATDVATSDITINLVKDYEDIAISVLQDKTVRRVLQRDDYLVVLAVENDATHTPHLYRINPACYVEGNDDDDQPVVEISTTGLVSVADNGGNQRYTLSDIAFTDDGYLIGCNALQTQSSADQVATGTRGVFRVYKWASLEGSPVLWFTTSSDELSGGHWYRANVGLTMAYNGSSENGWLMTPAVNAYETTSSPQVRDIVMHVSGGSLASTYVNYDRDASANRPLQSLTVYGTDVKYSPSPKATDRFIIDGELIAPREVRVNTQDGLAAKSLGALATTDVVSRGASTFSHSRHALLVTPLSTDGENNVGIALHDMTSGLQYSLAVTATGTDVASLSCTSIDATGGSNGSLLTLHLMRDGKLSRWHVGTVTPVIPDPDPQSEYDLEWERVYDSNAVSALADKTVRRAVHLDGSNFAVLAVDASRVPYLYKVDADAMTATPISTTGVVDVTTENNQGSSLYTLSDIAVTSDGKLIACNQLQAQDTDNDAQIESGRSRGYLRIYRWDDLSGTPTQWFTSPEAGFFYKALVGGSMAYTGSSSDGQLVVTAVNDYYAGTEKTQIRYDVYNITAGEMSSHLFNRPVASAVTTTADTGSDFKLSVSPRGVGYFMIDGNSTVPLEIKINDNNLAATVNGTLATTDVISNDAHWSMLDERTVLVSPFSSDNESNIGIRLYDVSKSVDDAAVLNAKDVTLAATTPVYVSSTAFTANDGDFVAYLVRDNVFTKWERSSQTPLVDEGIGIFAYDLRQSVTDDDAYTFTFKVNTTPLEAVIIFTDNTGVEIGRYTVEDPIKGENSVSLMQEDLPFEEGITAQWAVYVKSFDITSYTRLNTGDDFTAADFEYNRACVTVDNSPESDWFGSVYVDEMAVNLAYNNNESSRVNGLYRYNPLWQRENDEPYSGQMAWNNNYRITTDYRGRIYIPEFGDKHSGVYIADPDNLSGEFTQLFDGTRDSNGLITNGSVNTGSSASSVSIIGSGSDTKLYVTLEDIGPGIYEYDLGSLIDVDGNLPTTWTVAPTRVMLNTLGGTDVKLRFANTNVVAQPSGALWVSENLISGSTTYSNALANIALVNITPQRDYWGYSTNVVSQLTTCSGGGLAVSNDGNTLYIVDKDNKVQVFAINNTDIEQPTLSWIYTLDVTGVADDASSGASGRVPGGVYQMAFDYGGNLYVAGGALGIYSVPTTDNSATTPAKGVLTVTKYRSRTLNELSTTAVVGCDYRLEGRDLYGAHMLNDGRTLVALAVTTGEQDLNDEEVTGESTVDYIADRTTLMGDNTTYLDADWVKIVMPRELTTSERTALTAGCLGNVYGTVTDNTNLTIDATNVPTSTASETPINFNVVIPANFASNHVGVSGTRYFFHTPQVNEVVTVYWAMYDGEKFIAIPRNTLTSTGYANTDGLEGTIGVDMSLYADQSISLEPSKVYNNFTALVQYRASGNNASRRVAPTGNYVLYPLDGLIAQDIITGVNTVESGATVVAVDYYDTSGRRVSGTMSGVLIEVTTYSDGSTTSRKVIKQ